MRRSITEAVLARVVMLFPTVDMVGIQCGITETVLARVVMLFPASSFVEPGKKNHKLSESGLCDAFSKLESSKSVKKNHTKLKCERCDTFSKLKLGSCCGNAAEHHRSCTGESCDAFSNS